jgi:hypothetical protein
MSEEMLKVVSNSTVTQDKSSKKIPATPQNSDINSLLQELQRATNDDEQATSKKAKCIKLTPEQLKTILLSCSKQQKQHD